MSEVGCGHFKYLDSRAVGGWPIRTCSNCGMRLGPARDTPDVLVEIRAAEIAADRGIARRVPGCIELRVDEMTDDEAQGAGWPHLESEDTPEWRAGWLARQIATHEQDQS